jgi:hypothetical protein
MEEAEWYLDITEDFNFSCVFFFDTWDSNGLKWSCDEEVDMPNVEGFEESEAPWILSETVSCWFHEEEVSADYCENNAECFSFDEAVEHYFGEGEEEIDCENWEDEFDMEDPEWYLTIP